MLHVNASWPSTESRFVNTNPSSLPASGPRLTSSVETNTRLQCVLPTVQSFVPLQCQDFVQDTLVPSVGKMTMAFVYKKQGKRQAVHVHSMSLKALFILSTLFALVELTLLSLAT